MADYVEILDTQIEPDAPLTAVLAGQWRDNCIAIAEGAAGAPKVQGVALDGVFLAEGSASRGSDGTSTVLTVTDLDAVKTILISGYLRKASAPISHRGNLDYQTSTNNGASFSSATIFAEVNNEVQAVTQPNGTGRAFVLDVSGAVNAVRVRYNHTAGSTGTAQGIAQILILEGEVT